AHFKAVVNVFPYLDGLFVERNVLWAVALRDPERCIESSHVRPAEMHPVDRPGIIRVGAITHVFRGSGNVYELVRAYMILFIADDVPAFTAQAVDENIVNAALPALAVMIGSFRKI